MWPVHTWLPDAHVESADRRLGGAGRHHAEARCLRLPALLAADRTDASRRATGFIIALSLIAVVYIGLVALVQTDMKKLVAYSSIAHMGFVTLGFFIFNQMGIRAAGADDLARLRLGRHVPGHRRAVRPRALREIADYGGVVNTMPKFAAFACCSRWPTAACPAPPDSSASGW